MCTRRVTAKTNSGISCNCRQLFTRSQYAIKHIGSIVCKLSQRLTTVSSIRHLTVWSFWCLELHAATNFTNFMILCLRLARAMDKILTPSPWTTPMDYPNGLPLKWTTPKKYYFEWLLLHCTYLVYFRLHGESMRRGFAWTGDQCFVHGQLARAIKLRLLQFVLVLKISNLIVFYKFYNIWLHDQTGEIIKFYRCAVFFVGLQNFQTSNVLVGDLQMFHFSLSRLLGYEKWQFCQFS